MKVNSLSCFLMGLGAGAVISMLFAPKSGEDTRRYIQDKVDEGQEFIGRGASTVQDKVQQMMGRGKEAAQRANGAIHEAVEAGKSAMPVGV